MKQPITANRKKGDLIKQELAAAWPALLSFDAQARRAAINAFAVSSASMHSITVEQYAAILDDRIRQAI